MATLRAIVLAITDPLAAIGEAVLSYAEREPVRTLGILRSGAMVIAAFWPGLVTADQAQALDALAVILLGVDQVVRSRVTPA